jgi:hypothetical protein
MTYCVVNSVRVQASKQEALRQFAHKWVHKTFDSWRDAVMYRPPRGQIQARRDAMPRQQLPRNQVEHTVMQRNDDTHCAIKLSTPHRVSLICEV